MSSLLNFQAEPTCCYWDYFARAMHCSAVTPHHPTRAVSSQKRSASWVNAVGVAVESTRVVSPNRRRDHKLILTSATSCNNKLQQGAPTSIPRPYPTPCLPPPPPPPTAYCGGRGVARPCGCCCLWRQHACRLRSPRTAAAFRCCCAAGGGAAAAAPPPPDPCNHPATTFYCVWVPRYPRFINVDKSCLCPGFCPVLHEQHVDKVSACWWKRWQGQPLLQTRHHTVRAKVARQDT
jgi:hypothetical protein